MADSDCIGLLDTNILIRLVVADPIEQALAVKAYLQESGVRNDKLLLLPSAILEASHVLQSVYKVSRNDLVAGLISTMAINHVVTVDRMELLDAFIIFRKTPASSLVDAYHCAMARRHCNCNLVSFDRKLSSVDGITRIEPGTATS